jgi:hypothetical protein
MPGATSSCDIAFKEWAAVCEALAAGRQSIILRKGGIHEDRGVFTPEHSAFWLYPTSFHQAPESLTPDATGFTARANATRQQPGAVPIQHFAVVGQVHELSTEDAALRLAGLHIWSGTTIRQRFYYRRPGLVLLAIRVFSSERIAHVQESPQMAGCKSWVRLPQPLVTGGLAPVLTDEQFTASSRSIEAALTST